MVQPSDLVVTTAGVAALMDKLMTIGTCDDAIIFPFQTIFGSFLVTGHSKIYSKAVKIRLLLFEGLLRGAGATC